MIFIREIKSLSELEKLSESLIPLLQPNIYLILQGELGVGKTSFTHFPFTISLSPICLSIY